MLIFEFLHFLFLNSENLKKKGEKRAVNVVTFSLMLNCTEWLPISCYIDVLHIR